MNQNPLISVIIPVYNGAKYLHKCVDSVLAQTYTNLEIILIDDGSTDTTIQICDNYAKKERRIRAIHQPNRGLSAARNAGIIQAHGDYIAFADADDWVAPTFIETLWKVACKYNAPISVVGRWVVFTSKKTQRYVLAPKEKEKLIAASSPAFTEKQSLRMTFAPYGGFVTNKLFHSSLFKQVLFPEGTTYEDIWILYRLFQLVNKVAVSNIPLGYWNRTNENSISVGKFHLGMLDFFKVTDDFLSSAKRNKDTRMLRKVQRVRLSHICGFFKRMMLADFNDQNIIKPLRHELRRNLWILLSNPQGLSATAFGVCCCINWNLTKKILVRIYPYAY